MFCLARIQALSPMITVCYNSALLSHEMGVILKCGCLFYWESTLKQIDVLYQSPFIIQNYYSHQSCLYVTDRWVGLTPDQQTEQIFILYISQAHLWWRWHLCILFNHLFEFKHRIKLINSFLIEHFSQCLFLLAMCVCAILFERMSHKNKPQKNEKLQHSFVCPVDIIGFPLLGCSLTI